MNEKIKACYLALLKIKNINNIRGAMAELAILHDSLNMSKNLFSFHSVTVDTKIKEHKSLREAKDLMMKYDVNVRGRYK